MERSGITYEGSECEKPGLALGGLGTSTLEIGRDGAFRELRVQNHWSGNVSPTPSGTFLSVYARAERGDAVGRVLQLRVPHGLTAVPGLTYTGRFPFVDIRYHEPAFPCRVALEAFSPFVPHDPEASSLPLVFLTFRLENPGDEPVTAAAAVSWVNDIAAEGQRPRGWPAAGNHNSVLTEGHPAVLMQTHAPGLAGSEYLLACLPADGARYSAVSDWWRAPPGRWMGPNVKVEKGDPVGAWRRFLECGSLPEESNHDDGLGRFSPHQPAAAVAGRVDLAPGETKEVRFALVWFFPHHWGRPGSKARTFLGHQYAVRFPNGPRQVGEWAFPRRESLCARSRAWRSLIEESSLPPKCRALMAEVVCLLPRLSWWLADGRFVLHESIDCPRMQATILGIYSAPVLSALFPDLHAKSLRATAAYQLGSGEIPSTLGISTVNHPEYRVFNTGDASVFTIVTAWEMLWGGDPDFVEDMYPVLKRVLQWAEKELDADRDGIPDSHGIDQGWDTFPMHGAAAYIADQWMAALLAGEELALRRDDADFAGWCATARGKASDTVENVLWNGSYYDLAHDAATGARSDICFSDQFTYGTVPAVILGLGDTHPRDRVRSSLEAIWRLNVRPCTFVGRMGSNADGTPADSTVHEEQAGVASQSNAFTPASIAPLAACAVQHGMVDEGLALVEDMARVIIDQVKEPWSGRLLFDSTSGECFYGLLYSDCLILWDVMYALLGVHVDMPERSLGLAPPRVPVKVPVFGRLYVGQVEFSVLDQGVELLLTSVRDRPTTIRLLAVRLPPGSPPGTCSVQEGVAGGIRPGRTGETVLADVVVPAGGQLRLRWGP